MFLSDLHTCWMLRHWLSLVSNTCEMLRKWRGGVGWVGDSIVPCTCTQNAWDVAQHLRFAKWKREADNKPIECRFFHGKMQNPLKSWPHFLQIFRQDNVCFAVAKITFFLEMLAPTSAVSGPPGGLCRATVSIILSTQRSHWGWRSSIALAAGRGGETPMEEYYLVQLAIAR